MTRVVVYGLVGCSIGFILGLAIFGIFGALIGLMLCAFIGISVAVSMNKNGILVRPFVVQDDIQPMLDATEQQGLYFLPLRARSRVIAWFRSVLEGWI